MTRRPDQAESDNELLLRVRASDDDAFRSIYRRCQGPIYRFALHMSGNPSIAEDVTQETFMILFQETERFDPARGPLDAFLFGIGRNLVLRRLQKERSFVPFPELETSDGSAPPARQNDGDWARLTALPADPSHAQAMERVRQAILTLPSHYREVVVLCELQELGYEQAAAILMCAAGTIRSRLHRARALLAEKLRDLQSPTHKFVAGSAAQY